MTAADLFMVCYFLFSLWVVTSNGFEKWTEENLPGWPTWLIVGIWFALFLAVGYIVRGLPT
jgi:hypothetical protein